MTLVTHVSLVGQAKAGLVFSASAEIMGLCGWREVNAGIECWWACRCGIETQQLEEWAVVGALAKRVVRVNMDGVLSIEIYPRTLSDKEEQSSGS